MSRLDIFRRDMPPLYLRDIVIGLHEDYLSAAEYCFDRFDRTEAVNLLPFYRRAAIETRLKETSRQYDGIKAFTEADDSGFWNHTVVTAGDCIMTQCTVHHSGQLVRSSISRMAYAEPDNQKYLSSDFEPASQTRKGFIYGILIHGRDPGERFFPSFVSIVFPKRGLAAYHDASIDLFQQFPDAIRQCTSGIFEERGRDLKRLCENIELPEPELRDDIGEAL